MSQHILHIAEIDNFWKSISSKEKPTQL